MSIIFLPEDEIYKIYLLEGLYINWGAELEVILKEWGSAQDRNIWRSVLSMALHLWDQLRTGTCGGLF
jgi:hypothetical protein